MRLWKRRTPFTLILVAALLLLLPALAFLQYKWLGQVSQAERDRMKSNLHASAVQFAEDFDRELTQTFDHFRTVLKTAPQPALTRTFKMHVEPGQSPADGKGSGVIVRSTES